MNPKTIVFDLDDTLIPEVDYLKSAFQEIASYIDPENKNLYNFLYSEMRTAADMREFLPVAVFLKS